MEVLAELRTLALQAKPTKRPLQPVPHRVCVCVRWQNYRAAFAAALVVILIT